MLVDPKSYDPVVHVNGVSYLFIQHNNVYLMTASRQNCNAASLLFFLHRIVDVSSIGNYAKFHSSFVVLYAPVNCVISKLIIGRQVFKHYFEELEEESLRDNFVVVVRRCLRHSFYLILIVKHCD